MLRRVFNQSLLQHNYGALMSCRNLTMHTINENLYLCTDKPRDIKIDKRSLKFEQKKENTKPIVLMISWFYGKPNQINKYSQYYTDKGMDVLVGRISLVQFLVSIKSLEVFGQNIADILYQNKKEYPEIFIHTFSAGGCMWGVAQRMMKKNLEKYGDIPKRVIGQIWDSVAHPSMTIVAIPFALFPKNIIMRSLVTGILWLHLKVYGALKRHFDNAVDNFYNNLALAPALVIASKLDPIGTPEFMTELAQKWRNNGADVKFHCFDDSEHIKHLQKYPEEYMKLVHDHWQKTKLLERQ